MNLIPNCWHLLVLMLYGSRPNFLIWINLTSLFWMRVDFSIFSISFSFIQEIDVVFLFLNRPFLTSNLTLLNRLDLRSWRSSTFNRCLLLRVVNLLGRLFCCRSICWSLIILRRTGRSLYITHFSFEILEGNHDHCDIVKRLAHQRILEDSLDTQTAKLVNTYRVDLLVSRLWILLTILCNILILLSSGVFRLEATNLSSSRLLCRFTTEPNGQTKILVAQFIKDAIGGKRNKIVLPANLKRTNVRHGLDYIWIAAAPFQFSLWVSKSATNWQTTRKYAYWTHHKLLIAILLIFLLGLTGSSSTWFFRLVLGGCLLGLTILIRRGLNLSCGRLVNLTTSLNDSSILIHIRRLVISR